MKRLLTIPLLAAALAAAAEPPAEKSALLAYGSLVLGTAAPLVAGGLLATQGGDEIGTYLMLGGMLVGPSTGQFYAQSYGSGMLAAGLRAGGVGMMVAAGFMDLGTHSVLGPALYVVCLGAFGAGMGYSLIDTYWAVDRYNERGREQVFGITPTLAPSGDRGWRPGALAWMRF